LFHCDFKIAAQGSHYWRVRDCVCSCGAISQSFEVWIVDTNSRQAIMSGVIPRMRL